MSEPHNAELPDFIVKSTLGISLAAILLLVPFALLSFVQSRHLIGMLIILILLFCSINVWLGLKNRYLNTINLFGILTITITTALALIQLGVIGSYWASLAVFSTYFILPKKQAYIVNILFIAVIIPIACIVIEPSIAIRFCAALIGTSLFAFASTHEIYKQHYLLKEQSITDSLTGLYNRSLLQQSLENAIHQHNRSNTDMTLLMIDIDYFKAINDQLGHDTGDAVLRATGGFLSHAFRNTDKVFRIGGEEFLVLIYNTDKTNALSVAEKLRCEFEKLTLIANQTLTISIGISSLQSNMNWKQWMKQGDNNLYKAKSNGRNQVVA